MHGCVCWGGGGVSVYMEDGDLCGCLFTSHVQVLMTLVIQLHIC